jgi:hypothetical protein
VGYSIGKNAGFAGAWSRDDHYRAIGRLYCFSLDIIKFIQVTEANICTHIMVSISALLVFLTQSAKLWDK